MTPITHNGPTELAIRLCRVLADPYIKGSTLEDLQATFITALAYATPESRKGQQS